MRRSLNRHPHLHACIMMLALLPVLMLHGPGQWLHQVVAHGHGAVVVEAVDATHGHHHHDHDHAAHDAVEHASALPAVAAGADDSHGRHRSACDVCSFFQRTSQAHHLQLTATHVSQAAPVSHVLADDRVALAFPSSFQWTGRGPPIA